MNVGAKEVGILLAGGQAVFIFLAETDLALLVEEIGDVVGCVRHGLAQHCKQHRQRRQALLAIDHRRFGLSVVLDQNDTAEEVLAGCTGDTRIQHRREQIIEQLCGLLGCPGIGALVVRNLELVAAFEYLADQFVVGFKCLGHCFPLSYDSLELLRAWYPGASLALSTPYSTSGSLSHRRYCSSLRRWSGEQSTLQCSSM